MNSVSQMFEQALQHHQCGNLHKAMLLYQQILQLDPRHVATLHLFGVTAHQVGRNDQAVHYIRQALHVHPEFPEAYNNLGIVLKAQGKLAEALACFQQALALKPDYAEAYNNLGNALTDQGKFAEAITNYRQALRLQPEYAKASNNLGNALRDQENFQEAIGNYQQALRLKPDYAEAYNNLGMALAGLGKLDDAVANYQHALRLKPDLAEAYNNLGNTLTDQGKLEEAIANYHRALRLKPDLAEAYNNLGNALREQAKFEEAVTVFQHALRLKPHYAEAYNNLGNALNAQGKLDEALANYELAIRIKPAYAEAYNNLGNVLRDQGKYEEAVTLLREALRRKPDHAKTYNNLGNALTEQGLIADAASHYRQALHLNPNYAEAHNDLGKLHEIQGELTEAESAFRESIRLQPAFALPHARLAAMLRGRLPGADQAALEERLKDSQLGVLPRAYLLFALAAVLDAHGDYSRAADSLRQANALILQHDRARNRAYAPADHERLVDGILQGFGPAFFKHAAGAGSKSRRPVFVFGLPRSGTTLIEQVLASHSLVHGAGELRLAQQSFEAIPTFLGRSDQTIFHVPDWDGAAILHLAQAHDDRLQALSRDAARVVDKMPDNYLYLGLLAALFPDAVFIHCRRDLRDVAVSCWMTCFHSIRWANDPEHIASRFRQYRRLMDHWHAVLPVPIHEVNYENAVTNLEEVARRLVSACGLDWEPACLEFHRTRRPIHTASAIQVRQPIYQQSVARWKNYQAELASLFALLPAQ